MTWSQTEIIIAGLLFGAFVRIIMSMTRKDAEMAFFSWAAGMVFSGLLIDAQVGWTLVLFTFFCFGTALSYLRAMEDDG